MKNRLLFVICIAVTVTSAVLFAGGDTAFPPSLRPTPFPGSAIPDSSALYSQSSLPEIPLVSSEYDSKSARSMSTSYLGSSPWSGMNDFALKGNYLYCVNSYGLQVLDLTALPAIPPVVSRLYLSTGTPHDIKIAGNYAYITKGYGGLVIVNVSNPLAPFLVGSLTTPSAACEAVVRDTLCYVTVYDSGLAVINVKDPASPTLIGSCHTPGRSHGITLFGNTAVIANLNYGLKTVDISDPGKPVYVGSYYNSNGATHVGVVDHYAYLMCGPQGMPVIDIADPTQPTLVQTITWTKFDPTDLAVCGNHVYVNTNTIGLIDFSAQDPSNPYEWWRYALAVEEAWYSHVVAAEGNRVCVNVEADGIWILDAVSNPSWPLYEGYFPTGARVWSVAKSGDYCYTTAGAEGLRFHDVSDPQNPAIVGTVDAVFWPENVAVSGNLLFATIGSKLWVCDVTQPTQPAFLLSYRTDHSTEGIAARDTLIYLSYWNGLDIMSFSDPYHPQVVGDVVVTNADIRGRVTVSGGFAYLGGYHFPSNSYAVYVVNVSNPASPWLEKTCVLPYSVYELRDVAISGNRLYAAGMGLAIFDNSDPANPVLLATSGVVSEAWRIIIEGNYAYVADFGFGLRILDLTLPECPILVGSFPSQGVAYDLVKSGDLIYLADSYALTVISLTEHANCGNANGDTFVDISDAVFLITYIFAGGPAPIPLESGDADCSGGVDISDIVYLVAYIFSGGPMPCAGC